MLRFLARWLITFSMLASFLIYVLSVLVSVRKEIPRIVEGQANEIAKGLRDLNP